MDPEDVIKMRRAECGIIVVGPAGAGKSSFLASLIGDEAVFETAASAGACT